MSTPWKSLWAKTPLGGLAVAAMMLGLSAGSILAHDEHDQAQADKNLPPHERPAPAEPPTGGHANLAEAATNPVANLVQFQVQNTPLFVRVLESALGRTRTYYLGIRKPECLNPIHDQVRKDRIEQGAVHRIPSTT
jgi:hypothetical protein